MLKPQTLLLVGYRKDAIRCALALFSKVELLVPTGTKISNSLKVQKVYFYNENDQLPHLDSGPDLCLPLTESSVMAAALVTKTYKCHGYSEDLSQLSHDKLLLKKRALKANIPISKFKHILPTSEAKQLSEELGWPVIVKQRSSSGSRGLMFCHNIDELNSHLIPGWIAESYIEGQEYSAEVFIKNKTIIFKNFTNYHERLKINVVPHEFNAQNLEKVNSLINKIVTAYNINTALLHIEFYLHKDEIIFGEFAIRPPGGYLMKLIKHSYDFNPWEVYFKIFTDELDVKTNFSRKLYSSAVILHPGIGEIVAIEGQDKVKKLSSFFSLKLKKQVGDLITHRDGSGQDIGYIILKNKSQKALMADLESLNKNFKISLK